MGDRAAAGDSGAQHPEVRRRFARLRALRDNPRQRHRLLLAAGAVALAVVAALAVLARLLALLPVDEWFTRELQEERSALVYRLMYAVSIFGYRPWSAVTVGAGALLVGALLGWRDGLYLLAITVAQGLLNVAIKLAVGRPRPLSSVVEVFVPEQGYSFPSGHVMFYTVFFGFAAFLALTRLPAARLRWLAAAPCALLVALIGPSRIFLGAHWLSDVIAAYMLGLVLLALAVELYLARVAPPTPAEAGGLVQQYDEQRAGGPAPPG